MGNGSAHPAEGDGPQDRRADRADPGSAGRTRSYDRTRPTLLVNPPSDVRLRRALEATLDEQGPGTPAELEALMRPDYPRLVVRARSLEHESIVVWYVYREGFWVPSTADDASSGDGP
jgi:hypothetical protein